MKVKLLTALLASALLASAPSLLMAQARPAATAAQPSAAGRTVLDASTRILTTLETRRSEFRTNPAALRSFIDGELSRGFDRDYAARLVLGLPWISSRVEP
jgi:phospholipid transport system substrate-binding protein